MNSHDMVFLQNDGISSNEYNINSLFLKGLLEVPYDTSENIKKSASMIKNSIYERMVERFIVEELVCEPTKEQTEVKESNEKSPREKTRKFRNKRVETKKLKPCTKNLN